MSTPLIEKLQAILSQNYNQKSVFGYALFHDSLEASHHNTVDKSSYKSEPADREQIVNYQSSCHEYLSSGNKSHFNNKVVEFT